MAINRSEGVKKGVAFLPNLLTTANLFCGYYSIVQTIKGKYSMAVWLVVLAGLFDFLDGRVARMTGTQSDFGIEYDSLADLSTFCMAPALLIYKWSLALFGKFGVAACFLYFACGALRLARFNVQSGDVEKHDFQGLPTPAAAGTMVSYVLFHDYFFGAPAAPNFFLLGLTVTVSLLMVSDIRYRSMKKLKKRASFFYLVAVVAALFVILSKPEVMLFFTGVIYVTVGLVGRALEISKGQTPLPRATTGESQPRAAEPRRFRGRGRFRRRPPREAPEAAPSAEPGGNVLKIHDRDG